MLPNLQLSEETSDLTNANIFAKPWILCNKRTGPEQCCLETEPEPELFFSQNQTRTGPRVPFFVELEWNQNWNQRFIIKLNNCPTLVQTGLCCWRAWPQGQELPPSQA
jgi:hypothetical protein